MHIAARCTDDWPITQYAQIVWESEKVPGCITAQTARIVSIMRVCVLLLQNHFIASGVDANIYARAPLRPSTEQHACY